MELIIVKTGNLMGSPDVKKMLHEAGTDTPEADKLFDEMFGLKTGFGLNGQSTSAILLEPDCPHLFPALVDYSFLSTDPASYTEASVQAALDGIEKAGLKPDEIKSCLLTHPHGDHHDPRLLRHLPNATVYADPDSNIPGASPLPADTCPKTLISLNTPGHGTPHSSFIVDLPQKNLSVCIAGDLIMSHAHFLSLDDPLSFSDRDAGHRSVRAVLDALSARPTRYKMILPGHDIPFFSGH